MYVLIRCHVLYGAILIRVIFQALPKHVKLIRIKCIITLQYVYNVYIYELQYFAVNPYARQYQPAECNVCITRENITGTYVLMCCAAQDINICVT